MSEEEHQHLPGTKPVPTPEALEVNVRAVGWFVVGFVLTMAAIVVGIWWLEKPFIRGNFGESRPLRQLDVDQPLQPSPGHPQMPWDDMTALRQNQQARLDSYGNVPGAAGRAHIPISRAMDLLLQGGVLNRSWSAPTTLPYRIETQPSPYATPTVRNRT